MKQEGHDVQSISGFIISLNFKHCDLAWWTLRLFCLGGRGCLKKWCKLGPSPEKRRGRGWGIVILVGLVRRRHELFHLKTSAALLFCPLPGEESPEARPLEGARFMDLAPQRPRRCTVGAPCCTAHCQTAAHQSHWSMLLLLLLFACLFVYFIYLFVLVALE